MRSTLRPLFSILLGLLFLIVGHGMQLTLIPLRAGALGWSKFEIGAVGSAYYVGYVLGCFISPYLIRKSGHIRAFTVFTATVTTAMLAHALWVEFAPWIVFRLFLGGSLAGLYMILESWVNDRASNANRGFVMSSYIMVNYAALAIGQFMVTLAPPNEFTLFAISAMAMSLSAIPLALTSQAQPAPVATAIACAGAIPSASHTGTSSTPPRWRMRSGRTKGDGNAGAAPCGNRMEKAPSAATPNSSSTSDSRSASPCSARNGTVASPAASRCRIARRVGSASAANVAVRGSACISHIR